MWLRLAHPEVAAVSCRDCETWLYDADWVRTTRAGKPVPRHPARQPTPCGTCPKVPPSAAVKCRAEAVELTPLSLAVIDHYEECRAVGAFPDDPIVRTCARVIRGVTDLYERRQFRRLLALLHG